jgi:hypothetical protein
MSLYEFTRTDELTESIRTPTAPPTVADRPVQR